MREHYALNTKKVIKSYDGSVDLIVKSLFDNYVKKKKKKMNKIKIKQKVAFCPLFWRRCNFNTRQLTYIYPREIIDNNKLFMCIHCDCKCMATCVHGHYV